MATPEVNVDLFFQRLSTLQKRWEEDNLPCDALVAVVGDDADVMYSKATALQTWLLGYELTDTLLVVCKDVFYAVSSKKKLSFLKPIQEKNAFSIELLLRSKEDNSESFSTIVKAVQSSRKGKCLGIFKDKFKGAFVTEWNKALETAGILKEDVSAQLSLIMAPKDDRELQWMRRAAQLSSDVFSKSFKNELLQIVDRERKVKHSDLSARVEQAMLHDNKLTSGMDKGHIELCYTPIIQSGGQFQLKFSILSDDRNVSFDTIICLMGARYHSYCSNIVRTMMVQPSKEQQDNYELLLEAEDVLIEQLKDGAMLSDVYNAAVTCLSKKNSQLAQHVTKTAGFATGIEFRETSLAITPRNQTVARAGMVFCIAFGLVDLSSGNDTYALFIGDTVLVRKDQPAEVMTPSKKKVKNVAIFLQEEDDNAADPEDLELAADGGAILETRTRQELTAEDKRKGRQKELGVQLNEAARRRVLDQDTVQEPRHAKSAIAYKHELLLPHEPDLEKLCLVVDAKHEALLLPICGQPFVIHVSSLKNCSKTEHGDYTYLRLNFFCPGNTLGRAEGTTFSQPNSTYVKELVFKASNNNHRASTNLQTAFRLMKEAQKRYKTKEAERKELEGVVAQAALVLSQNRSVPRLKDLTIRPTLGSAGHRTQGVLEAHTNGFRYTPYKGEKVDILFNNIKHAIFQPSKGEMIVLLHFHLKHAILIHKKKYADIQFYTEVGEVVTDLGRRQNMHDRDDLEAEQAERDMRHRLDLAFKSFAEKVQQISGVEFDTPFRDLGFYGAPNRSSVFMVPTTNCLVHLTEQPVTCITLDEVELVHFERVSFHLKNFDMVFVFKDYKRKVAMINLIPMTSLDAIKEWLTTADIKYTEGLQSLNWTKIMKTINDDPSGFFENGGWSFLEPQSSGEEDDADDSDEDDGGYEPSSATSEDSDEDYTSESEDEDDEEEDEDSDEESGKDWDELEDEAREADLEKDEESDSGSRKRKSVSRSAPSAKRRR